VSNSLPEMLKAGGVFGFLIVMLALALIPLGIVAVIARKRVVFILFAVTILAPVVLGWAGTWYGVKRANELLAATGGKASLVEVAGALSISQVPLFMGFTLSAVLALLLVIGLFLSTSRRWDAGFLATATLLFCTAGLLRSERLMDLNSQIAASSGDLVADLPQTGRKEVGAPDQFAVTTGPLRPGFDRAVLYGGVGNWGALGLCLGAVAAFVSRRTTSRESAE